MDKNICFLKIEKYRSTYCIDGGKREGEVEVVAVVDVSVPHELEILISHHLHKHKTERPDEPGASSITDRTNVKVV